jgi:hypothetical protein
MSCHAAHQSNVLCFECGRSERDRRRAMVLSELPPPRQLTMPLGVTLTERQVAHRTVMLEHLRRSGATRTRRAGQGTESA